jgi:hypothetical protein
VKILHAIAALTFGAAGIRAQETTVDLPGVVVTGTFELRRTPRAAADSFMKYLDKQIDARRAAEETIARAPFWNERFWSYIPMRLGASQNDSTQFFTPSYLTQDYRNAARALEESRKHSLFETRP